MNTEWKLVDNKGNEVTFPSKHTSFRGTEMTVTGGRPPHKEGSTGKIHTDKGEFYPGVCDLTWVPK